MFPQMFLRMPTHGNFVAEVRFASWKAKTVSQTIQKHFLLLGVDFCFGNIGSSFAHQRNNVAELPRPSLYTLRSK